MNFQEHSSDQYGSINMQIGIVLQFLQYNKFTGTQKQMSIELQQQKIQFDVNQFVKEAQQLSNLTKQLQMQQTLKQSDLNIDNSQQCILQQLVQIPGDVFNLQKQLSELEEQNAHLSGEIITQHRELTKQKQLITDSQQKFQDQSTLKNSQQIQTLEEQMEQIKSTNKKLQRTIKNYEDQIKEAEQLINQLNVQLENSTKQNIDAQQLIKQQNERYELQQKQIVQVEIQNQQLLKSIESRKQQNSDMEQLKAEISNKNDILNDELNKLSEQLAKTKLELDEAQNNLQNKTKEYDELQINMSAMQLKLNDQSDQNVKLRLQVDKLAQVEHQLSTLQQQYKASQVELEQQQNIVVALSAQQTKNIDRDKEIKQLQLKNEELNKNIEEYLEVSVQCQTKIQELCSENEQLKIKIKGDININTQKEQQISFLQQQFDQIEKQITQLSQELQEKQALIQQQKIDLQAKQNNIQQLNEQITQMQSVQQQQNQATQQLTVENMDLRGQISQYIQQVDDLNIKIKKQNSENLNQQLQQTQQLNKAIFENEQLQKDVNELQTKISLLQNDKQKLQQQVHQQQSSNTSTEEIYKAKIQQQFEQVKINQQSLADLQSENKRLKLENKQLQDEQVKLQVEIQKRDFEVQQIQSQLDQQQFQATVKQKQYDQISQQFIQHQTQNLSLSNNPNLLGNNGSSFHDQDVQNQIQQQKNKIKQLNKEIQRFLDLEADFQIATNKNELLQQTIQTLETSQQQLQQQLQQFQKQNKELIDENEQLMVINIQLKEIVAQNDNLITQIQNQIASDDKIETLATLIEQPKEVDLKLNQLTITKSQLPIGQSILQTQRKNQEDLVQSLKIQQHKFYRIADKLSGKRITNKEVVNIEAETQTDPDQLLQQKNEEIQKLRLDMANQQAEIEVAKASIDSQIAENLKLVDDNKTLQQKLAESQVQITELKTQLHQSQDDLKEQSEASRTELQKTQEEYQSKLIKAESEIERLKATLQAEITQERSKLQQEALLEHQTFVDKTMKERGEVEAALNQQLVAALQEAHGFKVKAETLENETEMLRNLTQNQQQDTEALRVKVGQLEAEIKSLTDHSNSASINASHNEMLVQQYKKQLDNYIQQVEKSSAKHDKYRRLIRECRDVLESLAEIQRAKTMQTELQGLLRAAETSTDIVEVGDGKEEEYELLKNTLKKDLITHYTIQKDRIDRLDGEYRRLCVQYPAVLDQNEGIIESLKFLVNQNIQLNDAFQQEQRNCAQYVHQLAYYEKITSDANQQINDGNAKRIALTEKLSAEQKHISEMQSSIEKLQNENKNLIVQVTKLEGVVQQYKQKEIEFDSQIQDKVSELGNAKSQFDKIFNEQKDLLQSLQEKIDGQSSTISLLQAQVTTQENVNLQQLKEKQDLQQQVSQLEQKLELQTQQINEHKTSSEQHNSELSTKISDLQCQLTEKEQQITGLEHKSNNYLILLEQEQLNTKNLELQMQNLKNKLRDQTDYASSQEEQLLQLQIANKRQQKEYEITIQNLMLEKEVKMNEISLLKQRQMQQLLDKTQ